MIYRIPQGRHRAWPLRLGLSWDRSVFTWHVRFDDSCRYDLETTDQLDVNKLVGIGYLWHHHKDSARFGWRYRLGRKQVEILAYCYVAGVRIIESIAFVEIGKTYRLELTVTPFSYFLEVAPTGNGLQKPLAEVIVNHGNKKNLQYRLGPWFGGNRPAPHAIKIQIEKA